ncbi:MAG: chitobiase/beta-hexosaminidase C-terminal domain-containing protein, partial [Kiritimatiellae bacterium]|nr:chitobiase/beta-hexosaminidase C-terminal domain-containing protein [Kiritimatiellia bacterium]
ITATAATNWAFDHWTGDVPGGSETNNPLTLTMDQARAVTAGFVAIDDTDADGLPDDWETAKFGDLLSNGAQDTDADGFANLAEYIAGTEPTNALSYPRIDIVSTNSDLAVSFDTIVATGPGYDGKTRYYSLEEADTPPPWSAVAGYQNIAAAGNTVTYTNAIAAASDWYRYLVWLDSDSNTVAVLGANCAFVDTDGDGLPDDWEDLYFGSTSAPPASPTVDADGDGLDNLGEYTAGTDPTNEASCLRFIGLDFVTNRAVLAWSSVAGRTYRLEYCTNIVEGVFSVLATNVAATPPENLYTDAVYTNEPALFYRLAAAYGSNEVFAVNGAGYLHYSLAGAEPFEATCPFLPFDGGASTVSNVFKGRITDGTQVYFWKQAEQRWRIETYNKDMDTWTPGMYEALPGVGLIVQFGVGMPGEDPYDVYFAGELPDALSSAVNVGPEWNVIAYPYPADAAIANFALADVAQRGAYGASDEIRTDVLSCVTNSPSTNGWCAANVYWLPETGRWRKYPEPGDTADVLPRGKVAWFYGRTGSNLTWQETRPFPWPDAGGTNVPAVAMPIFTPCGGTLFTGTIEVALSTVTAGATIFYTTDGGTPTTGSAQYSSAVPLTVTTTVKARAYRADFDPSGVASAVYELDSDADGLPDSWEQAHFGDLGTADQTTDYDGEGLSDLAEYENGTDPALVDSDGDSFSDYVEVINGTQPMNDGSVPSYPYREWTRLWGSATQEMGAAISWGDAGHFYVAGSTLGSFHEATNEWVNSICLVKADQSGAPAWTRIWASYSETPSYGDYADGLAFDGQSNLYVAGTTWAGFDGQPDYELMDAFVSKCDLAGDRPWSRVWTCGSSHDQSYAVCVDQTTNVYVVGAFSLGGGSWNCFLTRFDAAGANVWTRTWGDFYSLPFGLATDSAGNVYVAGYTDSDCCWLTQFDADGNQYWTNCWGAGTGYDRATAVAVDGLDRIYVAGYTSTNFDGEANAGLSDLFLIRLDTDGVRQWSRIWGSADADYAASVVASGPNYVYVTGLSDGAFDGQTNGGGTDAVLTKFSSEGVRVWSRIWGSDAEDQGKGTALDGSNGLYTVGTTAGSFDLELNHGDHDIFVTKWRDVTTQPEAVAEKIARGSTWKYRKGTEEGSSPGWAWRGPDFDDSGWASGAAPFGYGVGPFGTTLDDMQNNYSCVFLRKPFTVSDPELISEIRISALCDDGYVMWLNGEEIARENVGSELPVTFTMLATSSLPGAVESSKTVASGMVPLFQWTNVLAVQCFNSLLSSTDLTIDVDLSVVRYPPAPDGDADGLADDWETAHFGSTNSPSAGPAEDTDGDGMHNLHEYVAGTDPTNAYSSFYAYDLAVTPGAYPVLRWPSVSGRTYTVQYRTNLMVGCYEVLASNLAATVPMNVYTDAVHVADAQGYYRIVANDGARIAGSANTLGYLRVDLTPGAFTMVTCPFAPFGGEPAVPANVIASPANVGDKIYLWNACAQEFVLETFVDVPQPQWSPGSNTLDLGVGFFYGSAGVTSNLYLAGEVFAGSIELTLYTGLNCIGYPYVQEWALNEDDSLKSIAYAAAVKLLADNIITGTDTNDPPDGTALTNIYWYTITGDWYKDPVAAATEDALAAGQGMWYWRRGVEVGWQPDPPYDGPGSGGVPPPAVATPSFSPPHGTTFTNSVSVTISTATPGATLFYTTDGSAPTTGSTQYTAAIDLTDTTTLRARGYLAGYDPSDIAAAVYAPQRELVVAGSPGSHGSPTPHGYGTNVVVSGSECAESVATPADETNGTRWACAGWTGTGSVPAGGPSNTVGFTLATNSTLTWLWEPEYFLDTGASGSGTVDVADGWYTNLASVTITATAGAGWYFGSWSGDVPPGQAYDNPLVLRMDGPRSVQAHFAGSRQYVVVVGDEAGNIEIVGLQDGTTFGSTNLNGVAIGNLDVIDVDGDGDREVLATHHNAADKPTYALDILSFAQQWQTSSNTSFDALGTEAFGARIWSGDFDADGQLELVIPYGSPQELQVFSAENGAFVSVLPQTENWYPAVYYDDIDGRHKLITQRAPDAFTHYLRNYDLYDNSLLWENTDVNTWRVGAIRNSLLDGRPRLWGGWYSRTLYVLDRDGSNLWSQSYGGSYEPEAVYAGDLRGDGVEALVVGGGWGEGGQTRLDAVRMSDGCVLWTYDDSNSYWVVQIVGMEDVDGDGAKDVFVRTSGSEAQSRFPKYQAVDGSNGVQIWEQAYPYDAVLLPHGRVVDADGDSDSDILVSVDNTLEARDGLSGSLVATYTFTTNVTAFEIVALYDLFAIAASGSAGGSLAPDGTAWVASGGSTNYTFVPDSGYAIAEVLVDGVSVGVTNHWTFTNVSSNHTLSVAFVALFDLAVSGAPAPHGVATPYGYGTNSLALSTVVNAAVSSPADETNGTRWACAGWTGTGSVPASGPSNTVGFTITANSTLTWLWEPEYFLDTTAGAGGSVDVADGWYTNGASVTITASPGANHAFGQWTGNVPGGMETNNPLTVTMSQARAIAAVFDVSLGTVAVGAPVPAPGDFDGDGRAELALFYAPADGTNGPSFWNVLFSSSGETNAVFPFDDGVVAAGDCPAPRDQDGDGTDDWAVFNPASGNWFVRLSESNDVVQTAWGFADCVPVAGDYDYDGYDDLAVYYQGTWYVNRSTEGMLTETWGDSNSVAAPGDFDGDGRHDLSVYNPADGIWWLWASFAGTSTNNTGWTGGVPVAADYDGDGRTDIAVYTESDTTWRIVRSSDGGTNSVSIGCAGGIPVPADYDGDGMADVAMYCPETRQWHLIQSTEGETWIDVVWPELTTLVVAGNPAPHGMSADYDYGTNYFTVFAPAAVNVAVPAIADEAGGTRYACTGWTGTGDVPASGPSNTVAFTITMNSTLTWHWLTEYFLDTTAGANGSVDVGDGWYTNGAGVSVTATAFGGYHFNQWTGDVPGGSETNNPLALTMNQARTVTAAFARDAGTITIDVTPDAGIWTLTAYPADYAGPTNGTVDLPVTAAPSGDYTVQYGALSGYTTPGNQTQAVTHGVNTAFTGTYTRHVGTITVDVTPDTGSWTMTAHPPDYAGPTNGTGELASTAAPSGDYTAQYGALSGYTTPTNQMLSVNNGMNTPFWGVYTRHIGSITIDVTPDEGSWTLASYPGDYAGSTSGTGDFATATTTIAHQFDAGDEGWTNCWENGIVSWGSTQGMSGDGVLLISAPVARDHICIGRRGSEQGWSTATEYASIEFDIYKPGLSDARVYGHLRDGTNVVIYMLGDLYDGTTPIASYGSLTQIPGYDDWFHAVLEREAPEHCQYNYTLGDWSDGFFLDLWGPSQPYRIDNITIKAPAAPSGDYTVQYGALSGYTTPGNQTQAVTDGTPTAFTGTYTRHVGTITVDVTPDSGTWTLTAHPADYAGPTSGTGDLASTAAPSGDYTVQYGALSGYT